MRIRPGRGLGREQRERGEVSRGGGQVCRGRPAPPGTRALTARPYISWVEGVGVPDQGTPGRRRRDGVHARLASPVTGRGVVGVRLPSATTIDGHALRPGPRVAPVAVSVSSRPGTPSPTPPPSVHESKVQLPKDRRRVPGRTSRTGPSSCRTFLSYDTTITFEISGPSSLRPRHYPSSTASRRSRRVRCTYGTRKVPSGLSYDRSSGNRTR